MFQLNHGQVGTFKTYFIRDSENDFQMEILPSFGANLNSLLISGVSLIDGFEDDDQLLNNTAYKSALLFPFPNRIDQGQYMFEGKSYQFDINEPEKNNALHGFLWNKVFEIENLALNESEAQVQLGYSYVGDRAAYPFPCKIEITYTLSLEMGFELEFSVLNTGKTNMPLGLGWHPYLKIEEPGVELSLPECLLCELDKRSLPTGVKNAQSRNVNMDGKTYDDVFELINPSKISEIFLLNGKQAVKIWFESGNQQFNYFQIYTPSHRKSIAIEPMSCNINAFNHTGGLILLGPEKSVRMKCGIQLQLNSH